ncbi:MAG: sulfate permease [Paracoccaceae bacterium]|nr:MAG: sulfate permease [Paracoccaceae bacterium]
MLKTLFPILTWGRAYTRDDAAADLLAAVIVTIMLVPQSLAYAMLAGLPPEVGLYASILPLVAYALFGTSRTLAVGPVAVVSLMTAAAVAQVTAVRDVDPVTAAITLAFMSGLMMVAMSALRLGFIANFLSHPVISGFITASGLLIAASQVKHVLGVPAGGDTLVDLVPGIAGNIGQTNPFTAGVGGAALVFLFWVRRRLKPLLIRAGLRPRLADGLAKAGPAVAVVVSILAVVLLALDARGVRVVGSIPAGLPPLTLPALDAGLWRHLALPAFLISLVGFVESVSVAQTLAARRRERIDANRELTALGAANLAGAVTGGYPVTGGFARSVVNFDAGARTPLAGAYTAVGILIATLTLTPAFRYLPQAVLAATIIVAVLSLVDLGALRRTWRYSRADFAAMAVTMALVLTVGVEAGISAGVALSILLFLWRTSRPHTAVVGRVPGTEHFRNIKRHAVETDPAILTIRVDESLYFANARFLEDMIYDAAAARPEVRHVVLMCPAVNLIDASALESLEAIAHRLQSAGIGFHLSEVKGPVMDTLRRSDFFSHFKGQVFLTQHRAMQALGSAAAPDPARAAE